MFYKNGRYTDFIQRYIVPRRQTGAQQLAESGLGALPSAHTISTDGAHFAPAPRPRAPERLVGNAVRPFVKRALPSDIVSGKRPRIDDAM